MTHWTEDLFVDRPEDFERFLRNRLEDADGEVADLLALLADEHDLDPATVLDVACGIGRHLVAFADAGLEARGVDLSERYVEVARERAAEAEVADRVRVEERDMRDLDGVAERFDLVTSFWTSVGYFDDVTNEAVLSAMLDRVAPGGALVLDVPNREGVLSENDPERVDDSADRFTVQRTEYDPLAGRIDITMDVFDPTGEGYDHETTLEWSVRLYAPAEIRRLCERAGATDVTVYADFGGTDLERTSTRMLVVAEA